MNKKYSFTDPLWIMVCEVTVNLNWLQCIVKVTSEANISQTQ